MQCYDNRGACRYVYMECGGIYIYIYIYIYIRMKLGGSGGMVPQGKFEFLGEIMLHLRPF